MSDNLKDRRKYLRLEAPIPARIITEDSRVYKTVVKNLSALGMRFELEVSLNDGSGLDITLYLPDAKNPVHILGSSVWHKENKNVFDVGCEFSRIEEDNKNTFLKFFCDLIYGESIKFYEEGMRP